MLEIHSRFHGLLAARQAVDRAENQLALAPGRRKALTTSVTFLPPQQGAQHIELIPLVFGDGEAQDSGKMGRSS